MALPIVTHYSDFLLNFVNVNTFLNDVFEDETKVT